MRLLNEKHPIGDPSAARQYEVPLQFVPTRFRRRELPQRDKAASNPEETWIFGYAGLPTLPGTRLVLPQCSLLAAAACKDLQFSNTAESLVCVFLI